MQSTNRRRFLQTSGALMGTMLVGHKALAQKTISPKVEDKVAWYNVQDWGVEGKGFDDTARFYDRLPASAEQKVRAAVWGLSRHSAGMLTRFKTSATTLHARYTLLSNRIDMAHMPATGVSGLDLYARDTDGRDRWLAVTRPTSKDVNGTFVSGVDALPNNEARLYTVYLPLYNGVEKLEIGVPQGATLEPVAPRKDKPLVFYGTSIMHGACASRPGMSISAIVGRRLETPTINLGFSGNGRMEKEVGEYLVQLDPSVYIIDCLPNMQAKEISERTEPLVHQLRKARPDTPILLVEDRTYTYARFKESARQRHETSRAAFQAAHKKLVGEGVKGLHYLSGDKLLGDDGEAATDGSHPNDLGMMRYADAYEAILRKIV